MLVELVQTKTRDGIRLDGALSAADPDAPSILGLDIVIMFHGVGGNFYGDDMFGGFAERLAANGVTALRVNNRGHDPVSWASTDDGPKRIGAAYEMMDDCLHDWSAWVDFAESRGFERIGIWGHSLGAVKTIYYMANEPDARVRSAIAASPPRLSHSAFLADPTGSTFAEHFAEAQAHVDADNPRTLVDASLPVPFLGAAQTYLDKYGPDERVNILTHLPEVQVPLLVILGTQEAETMVPMHGLTTELLRFGGDIADMTFASIPGADHFYTGQRDTVWDVVSHWMAAIADSFADAPASG